MVAIAYETVETPNGGLPLLTPMSEIAGRMAVQVGMYFLEKPQKGKGVLLGGVAGVHPGSVVIIGGGVVGTNALKRATGLGARVTVIDKSLDRLRYLDDLFHGRIESLASNRYNHCRGRCSGRSGHRRRLDPRRPEPRIWLRKRWSAPCSRAA